MKVISAKKLSTKKYNAKELTKQYDMETMYRRGYRHGYSRGMDDVTYEGRSKIAKFFNKALMPWTYFKDKDYSKENDFLTIPPSPKRRENYDG